MARKIKPGKGGSPGQPYQAPKEDPKNPYVPAPRLAKGSLPQDQLSAFNEVVNSGSVQAIQLAVAGLKSQYDNANGVEGRLVTGKAAPNKGDVFRSQAELVRAMSDARYDNDPAYRQDVIDKLDRSDLEF